MATEMQDDKYNGWAVIHKDYLVDDDGRNYHIVEVQILSRADGKDYIETRASNTCCGLALKPSAVLSSQCPFYRKENQDSFGIQLAKWQNKGYELCGRCVGHFYKDQADSN